MLRLALVLVLAVGCTAADPETARVRTHLEGALAEAASHRPVLSPAQRDARARALLDLRAYIDAEVYPQNDVHPGRTPIFIDRFGVRCAMAALIEASGHADLVQRIARDHLYAYIADLADDAELVRWLDEHGLTLAEAARIQPGYSNEVEVHWDPTASIETSVQLGIDGQDIDALLLLGARIGMRRTAETTDACDHCVYRTFSILAEYERRLLPTGAGANYASLLVQNDFGFAKPNQIYLLGGPTAVVGEDTRFGGKIGVGFSMRGTPVPILAEVGAVGIYQPDGFDLNIALTSGVIW